MSPEGLNKQRSTLDTKEIREINPIFAQNHINQPVNVLDRFWANHKTVTPEMARNLVSQHRAQFLEAVDERDACSNQHGLTAEEKRKNDDKLNFYKAVAIQAGEPLLVSDSAIAERQENWARSFEAGTQQGYTSQDASRFANLVVYENQTSLSAQATVKSERTLGLSRLNQKIEDARRVVSILATFEIFTDQIASISDLLARIDATVTGIQDRVATIVLATNALRYNGLKPITIPEAEAKTQARQRAKVEHNPQTSARKVKDTTTIPTATARKEVATNGEPPLEKIRKEAQASITEQAKQHTETPDDGLTPLERAGKEARARLEEESKKFDPNEVIDDVRKDEPWREYMVKTANELLYDEEVNLKDVTNWNYGKNPSDLVKYVVQEGRIVKDDGTERKTSEQQAAEQKAAEQAYMDKVFSKIALDDPAKNQQLKEKYISATPEEKPTIFDEMMHELQLERITNNAHPMPQMAPVTEGPKVKVGDVW